LELEVNEIRSEGAKSLAEALDENSTLTILNLYCNDIGPEGVNGIYVSLIINTHITLIKTKIKEYNFNSISNEIDTQFEPISSEIAKKLEEVIQDVETLLKEHFPEDSEINIDPVGKYKEVLNIKDMLYSPSLYGRVSLVEFLSFKNLNKPI